MGIASINVDSVPAGSFTPQEPLVELLRVCLEKDCSPFLSEAGEKPFLVIWLIKEWAKKCWEKGCMLLLVPTLDKTSLWEDFISALTCLSVKPIQDIGEADDKTLIITTPQELAKRQQIPKITLSIIDNSHINDVAQVLERVRPSRVVSLVGSLFRDKDHSWLMRPANLTKILRSLPNDPEACSDLMSMIRFFCHPAEMVVLYEENSKADQSLAHEVNKEIDLVIEGTRRFLLSHRFSLLEIYGDEFQDLIEDVPDPTALPLKLLDDFVHIKNHLGLWCAERAALLLIIKIEKLKTREKYERHFILLSVLYR